MLARDQPFHDRPLLGLAARQQDRDGGKAVHERDHADAAGDPGQLLDEDADIQRAAAGAPELLGEPDAQEPLGHHGLVEVPGELVGLVDLSGAGSDDLLGKGARDRAEFLLLLAQCEAVAGHRRHCRARRSGKNRVHTREKFRTSPGRGSGPRVHITGIRFVPALSD